MKRASDVPAEERFRAVFSHLGAIRAYARRRGCADPDGVAAEVMTVAWRRLGDIPRDDPRPWLYATARNIAMAEARKATRAQGAQTATTAPPVPVAAEVHEIDPDLWQALASLPRLDREALLLVAWEELTPSQAAAALGINPTAFRVRLLRARRRIKAALAPSNLTPIARVDLEATR